MMTFPKTLFAIALAALPFALIGAGNAGTQPAPGSVTISNLGGRDRSGFLIVVEPSGRAWALDGAGHADGQLQTALIQTLFADLAAAGPLAQLPERGCDDALLIGWNGQRSSNLGCSADPRSIRLVNDITAIQRALYVQSYRVAVTQGSTPPVTQASAPSGYSSTVTRTSTARSAAALNYASPTGSQFGTMHSNVGGYIVTGFGDQNAAAGTYFAPGSLSGISLGGFSSQTAGFQSGHIAIGAFSEGNHFSANGSFSSIGGGANSTIPRSSFSGSGFGGNSGSNINNNANSGLQNQGFSGGGSSFSSGITVIQPH